MKKNSLDPRIVVVDISNTSFIAVFDNCEAMQIKTFLFLEKWKRVLAVFCYASALNM